MRTLAALQVGEAAVVAAILGDDSLTLRLLEMGLTEGETVTLLGVAPLGDPLNFSVRGYRISLRKSEAQRVQLVSDPSAPDRV